MQAKDFLDSSKRRMLRLEFPDFPVYDSFSGLLDVQLSEVMCDSPDVEIGNLVVPELTVQLVHTDMKNHLGSTIHVASGIEQSREDLTEELTAIQSAIDSTQLVFARSANGCWFVADGSVLYSCWFDSAGRVRFHRSTAFESTHDIQAVCVVEERVDVDENGRVVNNHGVVYLFHETTPYLTKVSYVALTPTSDFVYQGVHFGSTETVMSITEGLQTAVVRDICRYHRSMNRMTLCRKGTAFAEQTQVLDIRYARYYNGSKVFCRRALSGEATTFRTATYGDYVLRETTGQDEETTEILCYGILGQTAEISAANFFTGIYFLGANTFADLYQNFIRWLNQNGVPVKAASQTFINLDKIPVTIPDWSTTDFSHATAADVLKEFAMLEGGNARMNHDNQLELGWCGTEPVLTVSAETVSSMRIGTGRLTTAQGITLSDAQGENLISVNMDADALILLPFGSKEAYTEAYTRIVDSFPNKIHLPFSADVLGGASPFLRAGDCVRLISRSGAALDVSVLLQDVSCFPFLQSRISAPEGTEWKTVPIDFESLTVIGIQIENLPEYLISGEPPDTSGMIVTALQRNGERFVVDDTLYTVSVFTTVNPGIAAMRVMFTGIQHVTYLPVYSPLYTKNGKPMTTGNGSILVVKGGQV